MIRAGRAASRASSRHALQWTRLAALAWVAAAALGAGGCGAALRRYPLAEPVWVDRDDEPFAPRPEAWYSPWLWDGADNAVVRPLAELWWLELDTESRNVNAVDEVPDSSWFTNRMSRTAMTPEEVARGACDEGDDAVTPPYTITRGKPDGTSRGFFVRDSRGRVYLMKPDGVAQPERAAASDAIGAAIFHAAGYFAPCNRVAHVRREDFVIAPGAEVRFTSGRRAPLTQADVDAVLADALVMPDGRLRFSLSQFVEGEPIAPWTYQATWSDDPNDVVAHEHRRDLRGMFVLSAWLNHVDSRQENTLASWMRVGEGEGGYVRHYMIDFSDTLGITHEWDRLSRRLGHSGYFDVQHILEDFLTLGLVRRPWDRAHFGATGSTLAYYAAEHFDPEAWRPGYPNHAYQHMTERDGAWMARIVARFSDAHLRALVERGRFSRAEVADELVRTLAGRRDRIVERYLTRLSPLALPSVEGGGEICAEDLAVAAHVRAPEARRYVVRALVGESTAPVELSARVEGARACVEVPRTPGATETNPSYLVLDVVVAGPGRERTGPLRVHAYDLGAYLRIVAVERPAMGAELVP